MNTHPRTQRTLFAGWTIAVALLTSTAAMTAQEKGATRLLQLSGSRIEAKAAPSDFKAMSCPMCKDHTVVVRDTEPKGLGARTLIAGAAPTRLVSTHGCSGCATDWKVAGHGKAKVAVPAHRCSGCGAATVACCNTSATFDTATRGMEKKLEVAPLK